MLRVVPDKGGCVEYYTAEPISSGEINLPDLGLASSVASRPFQTPEEELVARILDEEGVPWQYETVTVVVRDEEGKIIASATSDFYLPGLRVFLEVKRFRIAKTHQRKLALRAGYGFAYVMRLHYNLVALRRKIRRAIYWAEISGRAARRREQAGSLDVSTVQSVRIRLRPVVAQAG